MSRRLLRECIVFREKVGCRNDNWGIAIVGGASEIVDGQAESRSYKLMITFRKIEVVLVR